MNTNENTTNQINDEINFTRKQQIAFDLMVNGSNIFVTGPGGCGKSFIINKFIDFYRREREEENKRIYVTSTTGLSALIIGGQTIHRFCGIGVGDKSIEEYEKKIRQNAKLKERYMKTKVLIIDEISMMDPDMFDKIDLLFRKVRKNLDTPFGGIQLILSGDLLQLPPVNATGFVFDAFNWDDTINNIIYLNENKRQNEINFQNILNKVRIGIIDQDVMSLLESRRGIEPNNEFGVKPSKLFSKRKRVKEINDEELNRLIETGETKNIFNATYKFGNNVKEENKEFMRQLINEVTDIEDEIILTTKCQVMLRINIPDLKLANGSRGIIVGFQHTTNNPIVQFLDGRILEIAPHSWDISDNKDVVHKIQIPLQLAFAISFHKAQGSTLDYAIIDIGRDVFEYGQTYVALSRVKNIDGLFIAENIDYTKIRANPRVLTFYENLQQN